MRLALTMALVAAHRSSNKSSRRTACYVEDQGFDGNSVCAMQLRGGCRIKERTSLMKSERIPIDAAWIPVTPIIVRKLAVHLGPAFEVRLAELDLLRHVLAPDKMAFWSQQ